MPIKTFVSGEILTASDTNAYLNNGGLVYITGQTIGTAVSSVVVNNCFSSTYDNYRITVNGGTGSAATAYLAVQLGSTTSNYRFDYIFGNLASATPSSIGATNAGNFAYCGFAGAGLFMSLDVFAPFTATQTMVWGPGGRSGNNMGPFTGIQIDNTSFTGFTLFPSSGTLTGGTIRVYGYRQA